MGMRIFRPAATDAGTQAGVAEAYHGGRLATLLSGLALLFSGLSYYESALKAAALEVYVPPVIQYGRDGEAEVLMVPITIANNGSNTGTVLAMELVAENPAATGEQRRSKTFYSAFMGEHPKNPDLPNKSFAPISVPGRASYTETIRFYPQGEYLPQLIDDKGDFKFTLKLQVAASPGERPWHERMLAPTVPPPLTFVRSLPFISHQHLTFRRGTISMNAPDWKPAAVVPQ